jgi:hypothetical protein
VYLDVWVPTWLVNVRSYLNVPFFIWCVPWCVDPLLACELVSGVHLCPSYCLWLTDPSPIKPVSRPSDRPPDVQQVLPQPVREFKYFTSTSSGGDKKILLINVASHQYQLS